MEVPWCAQDYSLWLTYPACSFFGEAAKKAVTMNNMETQAATDSQGVAPSPVSKMRPLDSETATTEEQTCGQEESAEEEERANDECVEPIDPHDKEALVVESDDEDTVPPPSKPASRSPEAGKPASSSAAPGSSKPATAQSLEGQPEQATMPEESQRHEVEDILDSEEEKINDKKGTFQDWGLLFAEWDC